MGGVILAFAKNLATTEEKTTTSTNNKKRKSVSGPKENENQGEKAAESLKQEETVPGVIQDKLAFQALRKVDPTILNFHNHDVSSMPSDIPPIGLDDLNFDPTTPNSPQARVSRLHVVTRLC